MQGKFTSSLLAIGLIIGQLLLVQHAFDSHRHADNEPCEVCILSAGLDQALEQSQPSTGLQPVHSLTDGCQDSLDLQPPAMAFLARAPPQDLLSS